MRDLRLSRERAEALAELNSTRPVKVIAVTGGKGGVGKTTVSANSGGVDRGAGPRCDVGRCRFGFGECGRGS